MLNKIGVNVVCYENKVIYPVYLSDISDYMDLLLISNGFVSHYVHIKDFDRFMFNKTKHRRKNTFVRDVYSVLAVTMC